MMTSLEEQGAVDGGGDLIFGRYQIVRRLAIGGMGEIFLARQVGIAGFARLTILKSLLPDLAEQKDFIDQFLDEARLAATLNHPNIVGVYEVGAWHGTYFMAMEYVDGDNLAQLFEASIKRKRHLPLGVCLRIVRDAALGLDHAHTAINVEGKPLNIVHRDISPQNIMVRRDGVTKVVDFGIASASNRVTRTATGVMKGKIQYLSPEQLIQGDADGRVDQWALGVVFWELLTGRRLFKSDSHVQTMQKILSEPVLPPSAVNPAIPDKVETVVMRMLSKVRVERFPTMRMVAEDLSMLIDTLRADCSEAEVGRVVVEHIGELIAERTRDLTPSPESFVIHLSNPTPTTGVTEVARRSRRRRRGAALIVVMGMVLVAELGIWLAEKRGLLVLPPGQPLSVAAKTVAVEAAPAPARPLPTATLSLTSVPPGARVFRAESQLGVTPLTMDSLRVGQAETLRLAMAGYIDQAVVVTLAPGEQRATSIELTPAQKPVASRARTAHPVEPKPEATTTTPAVSKQDGSLTIRTWPWTRVAINGREYGTTPLFRVSLPQGTHDLVLTNEGAGLRETRRLVIKPGENAKIDLKLDAARP